MQATKEVVKSGVESEPDTEPETAVVHTAGGKTIEAGQVIIKANGWVKVNDRHLPPHTVASVEGDSSRNGPVIYESPHGRV